MQKLSFYVEEKLIEFFNKNIGIFNIRVNRGWSGSGDVIMYNLNIRSTMSPSLFTFYNWPQGCYLNKKELLNVFITRGYKL